MKLDNIIIDKSVIKKQLNCNDDYAYTVLNRLFSKGKIKKIIKSKYTCSDNIYLIASNIYTPCYISFWTASHFKGYTEQIINTIQIVTTVKKDNIFFENYKIEFVKFSKKMFFGYEKVKLGNDFIFIADDEKLIIDSVKYSKKLGNSEEILKIIEKSSINKSKLFEYLERIDNKSLTKKVIKLIKKVKGDNYDI